jgi:hypothetical protein
LVAASNPVSAQILVLAVIATMVVAMCWKMFLPQTAMAQWSWLASHTEDGHNNEQLRDASCRSWM